MQSQEEFTRGESFPIRGESLPIHGVSERIHGASSGPPADRATIQQHRTWKHIDEKP